MFKTPQELNIIAIDPSLRGTGVFMCKHGVCSSYSIQKKENRLHVLGSFVKWFAKEVKGTAWDLCIIEGYSMGSRSSAVTVAAEIGGIIRACFSAYGVPIIEIAPQCWKAVTGIRLKKASVQDKREYRNECITKFGFSFDTVDEVDAFLMFWSVVEISRGNTKKGIGASVRSQLEELKIKM